MRALLPVPTVYNPEDETWDASDPEWEMTFWPRIMWVDAGTTSGITVIWFHPQRLLNLKQLYTKSILAHWSSYAQGNENGQAQEILRLCRGLGGEFGLCVGLESFTVHKVNADHTFLSSPRITSKIEFGLWSGIRDHDGEVRRRTPVWQGPNEIVHGPKGADRLKILNLYHPGPDDINDSMKHCLLHMSRVRMQLGLFRTLYGWNNEWDAS